MINTEQFPRQARLATPLGASRDAALNHILEIVSKAEVAVVKVSHNGFDTHSGQQGVHAVAQGALAEGLTAMRGAMGKIGRWDTTLMMTYAELGRRPRENQSGGTDHGLPMCISCSAPRRKPRSMGA